MLKLINITAFFVLLLLAAVAFWSFRPAPEAESKPEGHLAAIVPAAPKGWTSVEVPIAETEEVMRATEKVLNNDQYLSRRYKSADGTKEFSLFISYWGKGKEEPHKASCHTPDRCWVSNGWTSHADKMKSDYKIAIDGLDIVPANYRELSIGVGNNNFYRYAVFWHMVEGVPYDYGDGSTMLTSVGNYVESILGSAIYGAPEQYFIRIDSAQPISDLFGDEGFKEFMLALQTLAIKNNAKDGK